MGQFKDSSKVTAAINYIAENLKDPGFKLIHFGDVVFTVNVIEPQTVEFHAMIGGRKSEEEKIDTLDREIDKLIKYLPKVGVRLAMTAMPDSKVKTFQKIIKEYKFKEYKFVKDGENMTAFYIGVGDGT
jgi:peptidoglycan/xylan/chitin deacetylase (PgdA/CDA1 family)